MPPEPSPEPSPWWAEPARVPTGVSGLDEILRGGLIANRLYLVAGDPGTGKTTLALQFLRQGAQAGERCLYLALSETAEELAAGAASHGWSLDGIEVVEIAAGRDLDPDNRVTMYHPAEVELNEPTQRVLQAVERARPRRLVFDSLSEFRLLAQDSLRYRRQVLAFKQFFVGRRCTVLMLDDNTAIAADPQLESIAHGVIALDQQAPGYGAERRRLHVTKYRGSAFRGGYHGFVIRRGGLAIFPRLVAADHDHDFPREPVASGVAALDRLLGGGPDRGTSTLLLGPAGSGKSTLAIQYAVAAAARGHHAAIFAFDENAANMAVRCHSLGIPLAGGIAAGRIRVQQVDPAELSPGEFSALVRDSVETGQARVVVIDTLNGYMNAMPEERFLAMHLHELLTYLSRRGVATLLVAAQHGMLGSAMTSPIDTSYIADAVVVLRFFEHAGHVKKAISVVKKRTGGHEETIRELTFDQRGIHLGEPLEQLRGILSGAPQERAER